MTAYRIKDVARINRRSLPEETDPNFRFHYIDISAVDALGKITVPEKDISFAEAPSRARRLAPAGSVVVSTVRTYLRAIAAVPQTSQPLIFSTGFAVLEAGPQVDSRFLAYHCQSQQFVDNVVSRSTGVSYPAINPSCIGDLRLSLPTLENQRRIVEYLDSEVARIDKLSSRRRSQLKLITDHLAAQAAHSTGRLRLREPTRTYTPLRRALNFVKTGSTPVNLRPFEAEDTGVKGLPWYTPAALDGWLRLSAAEKVAKVEPGVPIFPAGSILVTGIGESLGKIGYLDHMASGNQQLTALAARNDVNARFIAWQLWSAESEIREWAQYSRIRIINNDSLKSFPIYLPSRDEQDSTAAALDRRLSLVHMLRNSVHSFDRLTAERRQALITAAVTGQFDVTSASGRNVIEGVSA